MEASGSYNGQYSVYHSSSGVQCINMCLFIHGYILLCDTEFSAIFKNRFHPMFGAQHWKVFGLTLICLIPAEKQHNPVSAV
jgi:hypothetical protein